jgi:predicted phage terminase large subunit-like protein
MKIEDKASGTGLIQDLKLTERLPIVGIQRTKDKYTRLSDVIGYIESGYVMLPIDGAFTNDFIDECESFTKDDSHIHDDQVDPMIDAINDLLAKDNIVTMWENMI